MRADKERMRKRSWREDPYCSNFSRRSKRARVGSIHPSARPSIQRRMAIPQAKSVRHVFHPSRICMRSRLDEDGGGVEKITPLGDRAQARMRRVMDRPSSSASVCRPHHRIRDMHVAQQTN